MINILISTPPPSLLLFQPSHHSHTYHTIQYTHCLCYSTTIITFINVAANILHNFFHCHAKEDDRRKRQKNEEKGREKIKKKQKRKKKKQKNKVKKCNKERKKKLGWEGDIEEKKMTW